MQYQNANNSVRVSDEFMRAVEAGAEFGLRARQTGEVIETVDARELFGKITQAAWDCADPGIQYDDTINDWHTSPESGRINASNPCSEYMHLDNSSCNLASLNLMKFLSADGVFDAATFAKAVEFVITAMDISICFADFPTAADRRDHPGVPAAGHRLRQPRRAADGHRARLRLRGWPVAGRRDHLADERRRLQAVRRAGRRRRPVRRLRPQRRRAQAGHPQARRRERLHPRRRRQRRGHAQARHPGVGRDDRHRREERLPQRAGLGAGADRHHRPDDGLRHHRHRAGSRAGQVQEAGRRRLHADRQPDGAAGAALARLPGGADRGDRRVHRRARSRHRRARA